METLFLYLYIYRPCFLFSNLFLSVFNFVALQFYAMRFTSAIQMKEFHFGWLFSRSQANQCSRTFQFASNQIGSTTKKLCLVMISIFEFKHFSDSTTPKSNCNPFSKSPHLQQQKCVSKAVRTNGINWNPNDGPYKLELKQKN